MRFLVDAQLPPALARRLVERGHEAEHVADCGLADAAGGAIGRHAEAIGATIVTKDEDFATWKLLRDGGPGWSGFVSGTRGGATCSPGST